MHAVKYDAAKAETVGGWHWDNDVGNDALLKALDTTPTCRSATTHPR